MPIRMINYLVIVALWLTTSCNTFDLPIVKPTAEEIHDSRILREMEISVNKDKIIGPIDENYKSFTLKEWGTWLYQPGPKSRLNAWDCDDKAMECMNKTRKKYFLTTTNEATPAIGMAAVLLYTNFLGIAPIGNTNGHALCVIHVKDQGWFFYEEQTNQSAPLKEAIDRKAVKINWVLY